MIGFLKGEWILGGGLLGLGTREKIFNLITPDLDQNRCYGLLSSKFVRNLDSWRPVTDMSSSPRAPCARTRNSQQKKVRKRQHKEEKGREMKPRAEEERTKNNGIDMNEKNKGATKPEKKATTRNKSTDRSVLGPRKREEET